MFQLGHTRSVHRADHILETPDTFVRAPLPGMSKVTAIVHIGPERGARFTQYTAEFDIEGTLDPSPLQRFLYVLEGELAVGPDTLRAGDYSYWPAAQGERISATHKSRAAIIEKPFIPHPSGSKPHVFSGNEPTLNPSLLANDEALEVRTMFPSGSVFDFACNTMTYHPGGALPMVEIHVMEHGLLMLEGGGIYRLGEYWYPVAAGDFIYMAPYCPQWFGALGKAPAKYLLYKDWNR
jgi:(S)-ureidoglycine aminohydrolase